MSHDGPDKALAPTGAALPRNRLTAVALEESSIGRGAPDQEHERNVAIWDILECNSFAIPGVDAGPYALDIAMVEKRLVFTVRQAPSPDGTEQPQNSEQGRASVIAHHLSLTPFRRVIKDYELICNSYCAAVRSASPHQIEAIDMGRRGLHDEAATLLRERLSGKLEVDFDTARRLFTLIFALHWKG